MRDGNGLQYFLTDHLGSVLAVADASGTLISEQRYLPFGEVREDVGEITQTDFGYTFQRGLPGTGLMDYRARFYAPYLNRFTQPDTIAPNIANPQSWNRYSYVGNSPNNFSDPTGHVRQGRCNYLKNYKCEAPQKDIEQPAEGVTQEQHERLVAIREYALLMSVLMRSEKITDVKASAMILDHFTPIYGRNVNGMLRDLGIVISFLQQVRQDSTGT